MNRELKFRCYGWDSAYHEKKSMKYWDSISEMVSSNTDCQVGMREGDKISQFTGILDKNKKEIYEDDLVIWTPESYAYKGQIGFSGGAFWLYGETSAPLLEMFYKELEVIGNIYENPELKLNTIK